jgi:WD40 repeat protein
MKIELLDSFGDMKSPLYALADGTHADSFFAASANGVISEWNTEYGVSSEIQVKTKGAVFALLFDEATKFLWVGGQQSTLSVVDIEAKKEIKNFQVHPGGVFDIKIIEEKVISVGADGNAIEWHRHTAEYIRTIPLSDSKIRRFAVNPNDKALAFPFSNGEMEIVEPTFFNSIEKKKVNEMGVASCAFHPKKNVLLTGGRDGEICLWNSKKEYSPILNFTAHKANVYAIAFHPKRHVFVTGSRDKEIKVWDSETLDFMCGASHMRSVNDLHFLKNGLLLSASDDGSVRLWKILRST